MIYLRIRPRVMVRAGRAVTLGEVADVLCDASLRLHSMPLHLPQGEGVWPLDALQLAVEIQARAPHETVNVLGDGTGWLCRKADRKSPVLRQAAALILCCAMILACCLPPRLDQSGLFQALLTCLLPGAGLYLLFRRGQVSPNLPAAKAARKARSVET